MTEEQVEKVTKYAREHGGYLPEGVNISTDTIESIDFDSDLEQGIWDSLVEIYNESDYNGKETLIDFIVNGDNSSILRILKAKGKANG